MKKILLLFSIFCISIAQAQIANQPSDLVACDDDFDGIFCFDLSIQNYQVLGTQNPSDFTISYHVSQADADAGINILPVTYCGSSGETLFVRLEAVANTAMFDTTNFQIIVNTLPVVPPSIEIDLYECDEPFSVDGITTFDLSWNAQFIYGTQSPNDFTLNYFETEANAFANSLAISNITSYTSIVVNQTIWVRLTNNVTGCFTVGFFYLFVDPPSNDLIEPTDMVVCDTDSDEVAVFDLTQRAAEITGGNTALTLEYFASQDDFINETPIVDPTMFENTTNPQTVYVRYTQPPNLPFACPSTVELDIEVYPLPTFRLDSFTYTVCDTDPNGMSTFDWDTVTTSLNLFNAPQQVSDYVITYHDTEDDAVNNINALANGYQNTINPQTIFVRAENVVAGCSDLTVITSVELVVDAGPAINMNLTPMEDCDPTGNGFGSFSLVSKSAEIANGITSLVITYHLTQEDADNGTNGNNGFGTFTNTTAFSQTLYVRARNSAGCYTTTTLDLVVTSDCLPSSSLSFMYVCDDDTDGLVCVDLTTRATEALDGLDPSEANLSYYLSASDAFNQTNEIIDPVTFCAPDVENTIHIRVDEIATGTATTKTFLLRGLVLHATTPTPLEVCDTDGDGFATFVLDSKIQEITNGDAGYTVKFYNTLADADQDVSSITNSNFFITSIQNSQTIYARMNFFNPTFANAGCFEVVPLELIAIPPSACDATPAAESYVQEIIPHQTYIIDEQITYNADDRFTQIIDMPYEFDFFEQTYDKFTIGSNGFVTFDTHLSEMNCRWQLEAGQTLPSPELYLNSIYGVYHDIDNNGVGSIGYGIIGEAPFRKVVVFFDNVNQFSFQCTDPSTTQIVLYESFNFIDVQVKEKIACEAWNQGLAVLGIQNQDASQAYAPANRNMGVWDAVNEGYRFRPVATYDNVFSVICDTDDDGIAQFDLQSITSDLLGTDTGSVVYYVTEDDLQNNTNPLPTLYTNTSNVQIIYAEITNTSTSEVTTKTVTLAAISCAQDFDLDGVPTADEDVNGDGNLGNDDTDGDGIPDFVDEDDDGDFVLTNVELVGIPGVAPNNLAASNLYLDTDDDNIPNYRDADDDDDGVPTVDEDYNNNNDPTDDDLNNNNIPDYLDATVALGVIEFETPTIRVYPNPAKSQLTIETEASIRVNSLEIYSVEGRLVSARNQLSIENKLSVDVSNFASGFYILKMRTEGNTLITKRFMVE